jgi:exodeoxyribonuclease III
LRGAGYEAVWRGQKSWNGVAILARRTPILTCRELPGDADDTQSRYIEAAVNGVIIASVYAPNGNPQPGPKLTYKVTWLERLAAHAAELCKAGVPVVLAGDYNVVPTSRDIYPTRSWDADALVQPQSRAAYDRILSQGWVDAVRALHPTEPMYTFWDYMRKRWERDGGLRLDHILLSPALTDRLEDAGVDRDVRGRENASDHAPVWVVLRDSSKTRRGRPGRSAARDDTRGAAGGASKGVKRRGAAPKSARPATTRSAPSARPLLVIDGDSFAHRSYHALPKTILRKDGKGAGAIVGFANFLLRLYEAEQPRTVLVGWDTLDVPTERHEKLPTYQSGREFDDALLDQLDILPEFIIACGFANAKAPGYEADDFLAAAAAKEERRGGTVLVASGDRDTFQAGLRTDDHPLSGAGRRNGAHRSRRSPGALRRRARAGARFHRASRRSLRQDPWRTRRWPQRCSRPAQAARNAGTNSGIRALSSAGRSAALYKEIATMDASAPLPALARQKPTWATAAALARHWGLKQLEGRLIKLAEMPTANSDRMSR